jgi:heme/copper-type cytochrome/quinol oxidase subunit 2
MNPNIDQSLPYLRELKKTRSKLNSIISIMIFLIIFVIISILIYIFILREDKDEPDLNSNKTI